MKLSSKPDGAFVRRGIYHSSMSNVGWKAHALIERAHRDELWVYRPHGQRIVHLGQSTPLNGRFADIRRQWSRSQRGPVSRLPSPAYRASDPGLA